MRTATPRCPYCLDDLAPEDEAVRCARCRTPHHAACFQEHGGCCSYGCLSQVDVPAGVSIFLVPSIRALIPSGSCAFGPFTLEWRRMEHVPERRGPERCPPAHARLSLEGREVREGTSLRGRAAVYVPARTMFRTLELILTQGLRRPEEVARVTLLDGRRGIIDGDELDTGSHPTSLELRAPEVTGPVDAFALELVLRRGLFSGGLSSQRWPVYLLERHRDADEAQQHAVILPQAWREALPGDAGDAAQRRWPPPAAAAHPAPREDGWTLVPGDGLEVAARPIAGNDGPLALTACAIEDGAEVALRIDGGVRTRRGLTLEVRWDLCRPGGGEVTAPGFPARSAVRLVGSGALDPSAAAASVEVVMRIPAARLSALEQARRDGAHNAALRIGLGVEVEHGDGRRERGPSRSVTITRAPWPEAPGG